MRLVMRLTETLELLSISVYIHIYNNFLKSAKIKIDIPQRIKVPVIIICITYYLIIHEIYQKYLQKD